MTKRKKLLKEKDVSKMRIRAIDKLKKAISIQTGESIMNFSKCFAMVLDASVKIR